MNNLSLCIGYSKNIVGFHRSVLPNYVGANIIHNNIYFKALIKGVKDKTLSHNKAFNYSYIVLCLKL